MPQAIRRSINDNQPHNIYLKKIFFYCCFIFSFCNSIAQVDHYAGTWKTVSTFVPGLGNFSMEMMISKSEKYILYPACLEIKSDSFTGVYEFLLVRKSSRELAISKNKFAREEFPFLHEVNNFLLNGLFDHSKDLKGTPTLILQSIRDAGNLKVNLDGLNDTSKNIIKSLVKYLDKGPVIFSKFNSQAWTSAYSERILIPSQSPAYFSVTDTIPVIQRSGYISISSDKKNSTDIVSISQNGKLMLDQINLAKKKFNDEILLDTGMNIIILFAENFGGGEPNRGKFNFTFGDQKLEFGFPSKKDSAAGFIVLKMYCSTEKFRETYFPGYGADGYPVLKQQEKIITSVATKSKQIILAIWDDAVEDGDTVSISIDGQWIVQGFPVKKRVQFIPVTLQPGRNTILFIANNLGSIPPNTSVLEIIDGKRRKSFMIETQIGEKNLLRIFYDD